jgi:uncharacterized protein YijF (DUF1287 family)
MRILVLLLAWSLALAAQAIEADRLVLDARKQVGVTLGYDPAYRQLSYPGGDVPMDTGVCTDVVIRALRQQGLDLQEAVHRDMRGNFAVYPKNWGLSRPDGNIDHRRVPNLMTWFKRQGWSLPVSQDVDSYRAGDIVTWDLQTHDGAPLILHNIGRGTQEEDILFAYRITGHYRPAARQASVSQ